MIFFILKYILGEKLIDRIYLDSCLNKRSDQTREIRCKCFWRCSDGIASAKTNNQWTNFIPSWRHRDIQTAPRPNQTIIWICRENLYSIYLHQFQNKYIYIAGYNLKRGQPGWLYRCLSSPFSAYPCFKLCNFQVNKR